ncbi:hybrid sensor histidine kinase/response regulator transcription factor [Olivibacter domesticus]|nr:two-component regulator propeller domain-containing protein [Olivibacter domesticus]
MTTLALPLDNIRFYQLNEQHGLSNNHISAIIKDSLGFLWFGTSAGLNRYDGQQIKVYRHSNTNPRSINDNNVNSLFIGPDHKLWVKTKKGINIYEDRQENFIRNIDSALNTYGLPADDILQMTQDRQGFFWFLTAENGLFRYDTVKKQSVRFTTKQTKRITGMALSKENKALHLIYANGLIETIDGRSLKSLRHNTSVIKAIKNQRDATFKLFCDRDDDLWAYAADMPLGIYYIKKGTVDALHIHHASKPASLNTDVVTHITEDENNNIWLATDHGGINLLHKKDFTISYILHHDANSSTIAQNSTISLYKDNQQIIWIGTYKQGLSYYHKQLFLFPLVNKQSGLPFEDVNRFVEDRHGNLWIGTNGGGLLYFDRAKNHFESYKQTSSPHSLSSNIIVSMLLDTNHNLWLGTYYGGLNVFDGKTFKRYPVGLAKGQRPQDNSIWELYQDSRKRIWVGTLSDGLYYYNASEDRFVALNDERIPKYISAITEDRNGNLWVGGAQGIVVLNQSNKIIHTFIAGTKKNSLSNNYISDLLEDKQGRMWVATQDGLNLYKPSIKGFQTLRSSDGLPDNFTLNLLEDKQGKLWISTLKGLSCINYSGTDHELLDIKNYHTQDGLQGLSFNENAAFKTKANELIFGGAAGFNIIVPENIPSLQKVFNPVITEFSLFNKALEIDKEYQGRFILTNSPTYTKSISLNYDQNIFTITFSPLDYIAKEHRRFIYQLKGFNNNWLPDEGDHKITFTNLDPGVYEFKVKASLDNGQWSAPYTLLHIEIAPPFWKTPLAYLAYILLIITVLLLIRHIEKQRQKSRFKLQQEREEYKRTIEMDRSKTQFFTNISHEFRTPLSLVIAPIDKLLEENPSDSQKVHLQTMKRNAKRLLNLINQLLDLKKVDSNKLKLDLSLGDIVSLIKEHVDSFTDLAVTKHIELLFHSNKSSLYTYFDYEKLERITFNLLSNALKFTDKNGKVEVSLVVSDTEPPHELQIKVTDTGIGIPAFQQEKIFERYFQHIPSHKLYNQGNGIGLSITHDYVQLLGGTIKLHSEEHIGSTFTIILPLSSSTEKVFALPIPSSEDSLEPIPQESGEKENSRKLPSILLVDNDKDLIFYLSENLKYKFHLDYSFDAQTAWTKALAQHPDLIISDIQMPGDSGIELCRKIKGDTRTRHIPVILLTAYSDADIQISATNAGASDYIIKPFHFQLLISKIDNHLKQKSLLEKTYKKQLEVIPSVTAIESADEKFLRHAAKITEDNVSNSAFSVEDLAAALNISRVGLYKRLLALNGHTPSEFIRNIRLRKAAQLLTKSNLSVAEIAYQVGFNNPKQFSKYFKAMYAVLPSVYKLNQ